MSHPDSVYLIEMSSVQSIDSDCLILPCPMSTLEQTLSILPEQARKHLAQVADDDAFEGKANQVVVVHRPTHMDLKKVVLWGLGTTAFNNKRAIRSLCDKLFKQIASLSVEKVDVYLPQHILSDEFVSMLLDSFLYGSYHFRGYKTAGEPKKYQKLTVHLTNAGSHVDQLQQSKALHKGMCLTRDLANMAANDCTPTFLAERAVKLAETYTAIDTEVLTQAQLQMLDMNAYLAVNQGSTNPASMPIMRYSADLQDNTPTIVLIGKGVTIDTGGIGLKRGGIQHMIYDMCGAACVLGLMTCVAELNLPINLVGILATAENDIDGAAYRPSDILKTMSGLTVDITSTDAEGRLLMCDAMTYAERFNPTAVIDIATLTGAAITALGHEASGLMSNDGNLEQTLIAAGEESLDRVWPFPLWPEYQDALDSYSADMVNAGKNSPGMITAGCFLSRFATQYSWAHLDVAGTSFKHGKQNTATGRPLPLLLEYLRRLQ
jgi:leucyl aminopeptidase